MTGPAARPRRSLKHDDTFIVLDSHGDIGASAGGPDGLFNGDTRYLARLELVLDEVQPLLLGSNLRDDNSGLSVDLTNPDIYRDGRIVLPKDMLHIVRTVFLWRGTAYQRIGLQNHGDRLASLDLKLLFDSDRARLTGAGPRRTPPRATPPESVATVPDLAASAGGTQLLPSAADRGKAFSRPAAARSPSPSRRDGAGDTLIDTDGGGPPQGFVRDDLPGGTAVLKPGQACPPVPARKGVPRPADPGQETTEEVPAPEPARKAEFLGAAPRRPPPGKPASTNIMTAEETEAAQRAAQAKLDEAKKAVLHTRTRNDKRAELARARSSRGMWIALGVGTLAAVVLIVGLLFLFFADESAPSAARRARREIPDSRSTPASEPRR